MKIFAELREDFNNPLYRNSFFIALGRVTDVGFGFFFWTVAARLYSVAEVGIATALISSLGLVMAFSRFGFDNAIIRFMPSKDRSTVFNTTLWVTTIITPVMSVFYLLLLDFISPELIFLRDYALLFIVFSLVNSLTNTIDNTLLSLRRADIRFIQRLILGGRILLLFPLVMLGSIGIFTSNGIMYFIAAIFTIIPILHNLSLRFEINSTFLKETFSFNFLNYLATLFGAAPTFILPILVLNLIGTEEAAFYFIAFAIGNLVLIIPDAMTTSFFVEGSHGVNLRKAVIRTLVATYALLVPAILFIILFGNHFLGLFGTEYLRAFDLLKVIAFSTLFVTIYALFIPLQNIRLQVREIVLLNLIRCILLVGMSYLFLIQFGLIGAGFAWLSTYILLAIFITLYAKWKRFI